MSKCLNCVNEASYAYSPVVGGASMPYCGKHVPSFARKPKYSENLTFIVAEPVVEAQPEVVVEETPKPAPRKTPSFSEDITFEEPQENAPEEPEKEGESNDG